MIEVGKHHMATTAAVPERTVAFDAAALADGSYSEGDPANVVPTTSVDDKLWRRDLQTQIDHLESPPPQTTKAAALTIKKKEEAAVKHHDKKNVMVKRSFDDEDEEMQKKKEQAKAHHYRHGIKQRGLHA